MRIGVDARFYTSAFTGIGRYVYELTQNIFKLDNKNEYVLFLNKTGYDEFAPSQQNVKKVLVNAPHYSFAEQFHFWRALERENLDLMHFTHFNAPVFYKKPSVVTIHDLTLHLYPGNKMNDFLRKFAYNLTIKSIVRRAKKIIAVSQHTKNDLIQHLNTDPQKIAVIYEGASVHLKKAREETAVKSFLEKKGIKKPYLLYTGVWRNHKNLVNLIKAFSILKNKYDFGGHLVITGKEDPWYPEVKKTAALEHVEKSVKFTGLVSENELTLLYSGALLYVMPSFYEGFGLPILEAFSCELPVCCSNASSLPEICGEKSAVFFNPNDPYDMVEKINSVITNPGKMHAMIQAGTHRLKDFSWEKMAGETLNIYNEISHVYSS